MTLGLLLDQWRAIHLVGANEELVDGIVLISDLWVFSNFKGPLVLKWAQTRHFEYYLEVKWNKYNKTQIDITWNRIQAVILQMNC